MDIKVYVSVVVRRGGRVLIVKEEKKVNYGKWNLPGGHLEGGERIADGARREVREETGLEVKLVGLLGVYSWLTGKEHAIRIVYVAEAEGEARAGDEILEVKWVLPSEVARMGDEECLGRGCLREIVREFGEGIIYPVEVVVEQDGR